jgi:hypothetical protein
MLLTFAVFPAYALDTQENVVYFEDGSYLVTTLTESSPLFRSTKTGSKSSRYYNSNDELQWLITVTGTFTYNGITSQCTYVDGTTNIIDPDRWFLDSESPTISGATATYTIALARRTLGIVYGRETHSVSLTCDKDGNLS